MVAARLLGIGLTTTMSGLPSGTQVLAQLLGPILSVGVVFSTNRVVNTLVGGAAGSGAGQSLWVWLVWAPVGSQAERWSEPRPEPVEPRLEPW
jgi:hypothetical protein